MRYFVVLSASLVLFACGGGDSNPVTPVTPVIPVTPVAVASVTIVSAPTTFAPGTTVRFVAVPRDASNGILGDRAVSWTSSAPDVATVITGGVTQAKKVGTATLTATSESKSATVIVTVNASAIAPFLVRPFSGDFIVLNPMDHDTPEEFIDNNKRFTTSSGEAAASYDGHSGYDFMMPVGTPIFAAAAGTVNTAGVATFLCPLFGANVNQLGVQMTHSVSGNPDYWTYYAHLSRVDVAVGQAVTAGQQIGLSGNTGCTTAPHLHFQVSRVGGTNNGSLTTVDPYGWTGTAADPWELLPQGAKSVNLWLAGQEPQAFIGLSEETLPPNGTSSTTSKRPLIISAVRYQGSHDELNPNNEYVEVRLDPTVFAGTTYSLAGHSFKNTAGDRFAFPSTASIAQGQTMRIYVGSGTTTATTLYWGKAAGVLKNLGDCVVLFYPTGGVYLAAWVATCS